MPIAATSMLPVHASKSTRERLWRVLIFPTTLYRLLRPCGQRPRRCAKSRNKFAPSNH
jgi:hypothetical protein